MQNTGSLVQLLVVLERREPAINMKRFYVLAIEPTLFEEYALVREWGRIGTSGRRRLDLYPGESQAKCSLETWLARKKRKGYRVVTGEASPGHA